ncbi:MULTISPECIES: BMP family lipoprotein [Streptomyces]|uniref:Putative lipoprotein n=1 Tax=Streptomyces venezuelae (strain ATCC 10712 / CBS 650.69 / DSM 40230 / JCM 4526 / NBRC 13096 / PD 04745) TaxID=953739 RepID=F2RL80_STRVP|nr:BMP family ABC transporter substrate-binding protein [Streptomyces venezuelae]APE23513.1 BMP family ABC transporter substrate-binding protein [Streptomyces venezuelae]QES00886.1 BMP family ABC transporter substrate-binding protein [Streptomyces venezuelae ATCC 10712]CCA57839.1 putative lipoprotein [Streptomyces venezuelae ATCC 10712]
MRRITRITTVGIASAALALSATACGKSSTDSGSSSSTDSKTTKAAIAYDIGGRGDQSFNDAAYAGLKKAEDELGVKGAEAEPSEGEGDADKVQRLTALARAGNNPVIGVGFAYAPAIEKVAKAYPKTTFGLIDDTSKTGPNIANLVFNEEQGSYLAGVAAAKASKTGTVGFIGGVEVPLIKKFEAGFAQGVKDTNPKAKVLVQYLTQPPNFDGFSKPDLGKAAAEGQLDKGADVIYAAAGLAGSGSIEAAATAGKWAIGVDSDQYNQAGLASYKAKILTSVTKDVSDSVFNLIKSVKDGKPQTGEIRYGLATDGVGLSDSNPEYKKMTDLIAAVDKAKKDIVDGKITVKTAP